MTIEDADVIRDKLLSKSSLVASGCRIWKGTPLQKTGYGRLSVGSRKDGSRKSLLAHRASYLAFRGPIPNGMFVCHVCDTPSCINPDHLFLGTPWDNMQDKVRKGRHLTLEGEKNPAAKLSEKRVTEIRNLLSIGRSVTSIARQFGVCHQLVSQIRQGRIWKRLADLKAKSVA